MKVTVDTSSFMKLLATIGKVLPNRSPSVANQCVRLTGEKSTLRGYGSSGDACVAATIPADVATPGECIVKCADVLGIVQTISGKATATVTLDAASEVLTIKADTSRFKLYTLALDILPMPIIEDDAKTAEYDVGYGELSSDLAAVEFASGSEDSRYVISGVAMFLGEDGGTAATDGRRLAVKGKISKAVTLLASPTVRFILGLKLEKDSTVRVTVGRQGVKFVTDAVTYYGNAIEGTFPPIDGIIPDKSDREYTFAREGLLSALKQSEVLTGEESRGVVMKFIGKSLTLTSRSAEIGESCIDTEATAATDATEFVASFNPVYLIECLNALDSETVTLGFTQHNRPLKLTNGGTFRYVVMPLALPQ